MLALALRIGYRGGWPLLYLMCALTGGWGVVYEPKSDAWAQAYAVPMYASLLAVRFLAACEVLWKLGSSRGLRAYLFGSGGVALGWMLIAWQLHGVGISRVVQGRSYIQIAEAVFLLLPLMIVWLLDDRRDVAMRYGWTLLVLLSSHAALSGLYLCGSQFPHLAWPWWNGAAYCAALGCCVNWWRISRRPAPVGLLSPL